MITQYPILLNKISFEGLGFDKKNFDGAVFYARKLLLHKGAVSTQIGEFKDVIDEIIEDSIKTNLPSSGCANLETNFASWVICSEGELKEKLRLYGDDYHYLKRSCIFNICPNMNSVVNHMVEARDFDYTNVRIKDLIVCLRAGTQEMADALMSCFDIEHFSYSDIDEWSQKHPVLSQMASTILNIGAHIPPRQVLNFLPDEKKAVIKIIEFNEANKNSGVVLYARKWDVEKGPCPKDLLDEKIIDWIHKDYPDAQCDVRWSVFNNDIEDILKLKEGLNMEQSRIYLAKIPNEWELWGERSFADIEVYYFEDKLKYPRTYILVSTKDKEEYEQIRDTYLKFTDYVESLNTASKQ